MMKNKNDDSALLLSEVQAPLEAITRSSGSSGRPSAVENAGFCFAFEAAVVISDSPKS